MQQQQILFWQNERNCLTIKAKVNICVIFENYFKITLSTETNQKKHKCQNQNKII